MAELNWDAVKPTNVFASAVQAQRAGQQARDEVAARNAFAVYGKDPEGAIAALRPVDPEAAYRLERQREEARQRAYQERQDQERRAALNMAAKGDIPGATSAANGDPDALDAISKMDEAQRSAAKERAGVLVSVFSNLERMDPNQARSYKSAVAPSLVASGMFTQEQIDRFDPTPDNIATMKAQALGLKGVLDQDYRDRELRRRELDTQADNDTARARLGVAQQNAATNAYRARKSGGGSSGSAEGAPAAPMRVTDKATYDRLPSGSVFIAPDGTTRRKP